MLTIEMTGHPIKSAEALIDSSLADKLNGVSHQLRQSGIDDAFLIGFALSLNKLSAALKDDFPLSASVAASEADKVKGLFLASK